MIICQHGWVSQCLLKYRYESLPEEEHWEDAHYPIPKCLGGTDTVKLWSRDHAVHGVLQTLELNHSCMHGFRTSWDKSLIESFYPEYLDLYSEAKAICGRIAGLRGGAERAKVLNEEKNAEGKSVNAVKGGRKVSQMQHALKDEDGKSVYGKNLSRKAHEKKDELGRSITAILAVTETHRVKGEDGKSINAVRAGKKGALVANSQRWVDPDHPELGQHSAATLASMQKRRGYPHGTENRIKVG